jgi:hypothetical protein
MFSALFRRAQATVDNAIDDVLNRILIVTPFLIAIGFATAALGLRLTREFGAEVANLFLAGLFVALGLIVALVVHLRKSPPLADEPSAEAAETDVNNDDAAMRAVDRELLSAVLTSATPLVLPRFLPMLMRNLPLLAVIVASLFILLQPSAAAQGEPQGGGDDSG